MDQLPNLGREQEMLSIMGLKSIDELFSNIPDEVRRTEPLHYLLLSPRKKFGEMLNTYSVQILILILDHLFFQRGYLEISYQRW